TRRSSDPLARTYQACFRRVAAGETPQYPCCQGGAAPTPSPLPSTATEAGWRGCAPPHQDGPSPPQPPGAGGGRPASRLRGTLPHLAKSSAKAGWAAVRPLLACTAAGPASEPSWYSPPPPARTVATAERATTTRHARFVRGGQARRGAEAVVAPLKREASSLQGWRACHHMRGRSAGGMRSRAPFASPMEERHLWGETRHSTPCVRRRCTMLRRALA